MAAYSGVGADGLASGDVLNLKPRADDVVVQSKLPYQSPAKGTTDSASHFSPQL